MLVIETIPFNNTNGEVRIRIHGILYKVSGDEIKPGDLVLDIRKDYFSYGFCDGIFNGRIAVRDGCVTEGIERKYCVKLVMCGDHKALN